MNLELTIGGNATYHDSGLQYQDTKPQVHNITEKEFIRLYNRHWNHIYEVIHSLTGNETISEELTQNTFLKLLKKYSQIKHKNMMKKWLVRVAINEAYMWSKQADNRYRERGKLVSLETLMNRGCHYEDGGFGWDYCQSTLTNTAKDPEQILSSKEAHEFFLAEADHALKKLKETCPDPRYWLFMIFHLNGLSDKEIAEHEGTTTATVKTVIHRARKDYLRPELEKNGFHRNYFS